MCVCGVLVCGCGNCHASAPFDALDSDNSGQIGWHGEVYLYEDLEVVPTFRRRLQSSLPLASGASQNETRHATSAKNLFKESSVKHLRTMESGTGSNAHQASLQRRKLLDICSNTCSYSYDSECDDGGPGSDYSICGFGTDCADCGVRSDEDYNSGGGSSSGGSNFGCASGEENCVCNNDCSDAFDGVCDDGGTGSGTTICNIGSDCGDCGPRYLNCGENCDTLTFNAGNFPTVSAHGCATDDNGICEDGGPGAESHTCAFGQDSTDCGARAVSGIGFCEHTCNSSSVLESLVALAVLQLLSWMLLATGIPLIRQYDDHRRAKVCANGIFVVTTVLFTVGLYVTIGGCALNSQMSSIVNVGLSCFYAVTAFAGVSFFFTVMSWLPRSYYLSYSWLITGILIAFAMVMIHYSPERLEFNVESTSVVSSQRPAFYVAELFLGKSWMEQQYWMISSAVTTFFFMAAVVANINYACRAEGNCNCRQGCVYMEYVPIRLLALFIVQLYCYSAERPQIGTWVLTLLVICLLTLGQSGLLAVLSFCKAWREKQNENLVHPDPGPAPEFEQLNVATIVDRVTSNPDGMEARAITEQPQVVVQAAEGLQRVWGTHQCDDSRDIKLPPRFPMAFFRPTCKDGYISLGDVLAVDPTVADTDSIVDESGIELELQEDMDHFREAASSLGAKGVAVKAKQFAQVAKAVNLDVKLKAKFEASAKEKEDVDAAITSAREQRRSKVSEALEGPFSPEEDSVATALLLPKAVIPARHFTLVWRNHPSWNRSDLEDLSIWIPSDEVIDGVRYRALGCVAKLGVGDPEPGCIGLVVESALQPRSNGQWHAAGGFRDPATTLQMQWSRVCTLFNTEALGSVL